MQTPHRFFAFFAGGAAGDSSATTLGDFGSALDDSGFEASSSTLTGLADGMGNEVDGLTFMSAMESVTFFWLSESVEGRRVAKRILVNLETTRKTSIKKNLSERKSYWKFEFIGENEHEND